MMVAAEVYRNYHIIEIQKRNPNHGLSMMCRIIIAVLFWNLCPLLAVLEHHWFGWDLLRRDQYFVIPIFQTFSFFFLFDWWLNISRTRPYWYLGGNSWFDRFQRDHGGAFGWFWWKLMLFLGGTSAVAMGIDRIKEYSDATVNYIF